MWEELEEDDPELVTNSPPCTPFSVLQELNFFKMDPEKVIHMVSEGLHHVEVSAEVCEWQHHRGKLFLFEHPRLSRAWDEACLQRLLCLPGVYVCYTDMCRYGMKIDGKPVKKPTMWITNSKHIARELQLRCQGDHPHEHLMGGKAAAAAQYPEPLCQAIVRGLKAHLRKVQGGGLEVPCADVLVELEDVDTQESSSDTSSSSDSDESDLEEALDEEVSRAGKPIVGRKEKDATRIEAAVSEKDRAEVKRLHENLGHPSLPSFLRFLRAGRVREEVIKWTRKEFRCEVCQSTPLPKAPRPSIVPKHYSPGVAVGIDVFFIPDILNQKSVPVLNIVDLGTNYQTVEILSSKSPAHIFRTFWRVWARVFGMPQYITVDEGREFRGGFSQLCAASGTVVVRTAARAPWQNGRVERHGGIIKSMIERSREELAPESLEELSQILHACECAKNRYSNRSGYSPTQRQIGQWPRMPSNLLSDEELDPALSSAMQQRLFPSDDGDEASGSGCLYEVGKSRGSSTGFESSPQGPT